VPLLQAAAVHSVNRVNQRTAAPQLVALDIDGTLLQTVRPPSDPIIAEARNAVAAGHHLVLATGRSLVGAIQAARWLGLRDGFLVTSNGAITARIGDGKVKVVERSDVDVERVVRYVAPKLRLRMAAEIPGHGYRVSARFQPHELHQQTAILLCNQPLSPLMPMHRIRTAQFTKLISTMEKHYWEPILPALIALTGQA
jgi:hypothetical protein